MSQLYTLLSNVIKYCWVAVRSYLSPDLHWLSVSSPLRSANKTLPGTALRHPG